MSIRQEELSEHIDQGIGCVYDAAKAADGEAGVLELLKQAADALGYARAYAERLSEQSNEELQHIRMIYNGWSPADLEKSQHDAD